MVSLMYSKTKKEGNMTTQDLRETQEYVKKEVDSGRMTREEGIQLLLQKTIEILQSLKMPEVSDKEFMKDQEYYSLNIN